MNRCFMYSFMRHIDTVDISTSQKKLALYVFTLSLVVEEFKIVFYFQGGQYVLNLVDYYGGTFLILAMGIGEVIGIFWIYG